MKLELADKNIAFRRVGVVQSSTTEGAVATRAVDGNESTNYHHHTCTRTAEELHPWWQINFFRSYIISRVEMVNRGAYGKVLPRQQTKAPCGNVATMLPFGRNQIDKHNENPSWMMI